MDMAWTESGRFLKIFIPRELSEALVARGRRYRRTLEFFEGGKFVFLGEGWPKNETIDRSFRSSEPFRCFVVWNVHRGFRFVRGSTRKNFVGTFVDIFRTTIPQFRRERVNGRTTRMILSDLRSLIRSQIALALVLMAGVHVRLSTRIQFHRVVHSTLYEWNELYPSLLSCYNYWKLFQSVRNILLKL